MNKAHPLKQMPIMSGTESPPPCWYCPLCEDVVVLVNVDLVVVVVVVELEENEAQLDENGAQLENIGDGVGGLELGWISVCLLSVGCIYNGHYHEKNLKI